jgi:hypothetical protein
VWCIHNYGLQMERKHNKIFSQLNSCWRSHSCNSQGCWWKFKEMFFCHVLRSSFDLQIFFSRWLCYIILMQLCKRTTSSTQLQGFGGNLMCPLSSTMSSHNTLNWLILLLSKCLALATMNGCSTPLILWRINYRTCFLHTWIYALNFTICVSLLCKIFLIMNMSLPSGLAKCTCDNMHVFGDLKNVSLSGKLDVGVTFLMSPHYYSYINCLISFWIVLFSFTFFHLAWQVQFMDVSF